MGIRGRDRYFEFGDGAGIHDTEGALLFRLWLGFDPLVRYPSPFWKKWRAKYYI